MAEKIKRAQTTAVTQQMAHGVPCKYNPAVHLPAASQMAKLGATSADIADGLGISLRQLAAKFVW
jgi:thiamine monophosphate kinase